MKRSFLMTLTAILFLATVSILPAIAQTNVAVDKPVMVDSENSSLPAWKAVDGLNYSNVNRWVSDDNGYPHWIEVDLQQDYQIEEIRFYTGEYGTNHPVYEYQIQYEEEGNWVDIVSKSANTNSEVSETFDPVICSKVRLNALSGEGNKLMLYEMEIFAEFNLAPTINEISDPQAIYFDADIQSLILTGIATGDDDQTITIEANSFPAGLLTIVDIVYDEATSTAVLRYQPIGTEGIAAVTVSVQDNGGCDFGGIDTTTSVFNVEILDPDKNYPPSFTQITDKVLVADEKRQDIIIQGISDGDRNDDQKISFIASETGNSLLENLAIQYTRGSEYAVLSYSPVGNEGNTAIRIVARDDSGSKTYGTDSLVMSFNVEVVDPGAVSSLEVDYSSRLQLMQGFGAFGFEKVDWAHAPFHTREFIDLIIDDLGLSILRIPLKPGFELVNDNDDPDVFDWDKFRDGLDEESVAMWIRYLEDMAARGPEKLIVSVWSPPAWMKTNGSTINGGRLITDYYEEYAEYIAAFITLVKEKSGLDIYAISLQNEPTFKEPYNSCQYTPAEYVKLIKVVGKRLEREGIETTFFYPEEVFVRDYDIGPWMEALNDDPEAAQYVDIMALHGYATDGIASGTIGNDKWKYYYDNYANHPVHPKEMWMSESSGTLNQWEGGAFNTGIALSNAINYGSLSAWVWWMISTESASDIEDPGHNTALLVNGEKLPRYYMFKQFYRYIRPGAYHVDSESSDLDVLVSSFIDSDENSTTHVLINRSDTRKIVKFNTEFSPDVHIFRSDELEKCIEVFSLSENIIVLPPKSISTIYDRQDSANHAPTLDPVKDTVIYVPLQEIVSIKLTGISDGDPDMEQILSLAVSSTDTLLVPDAAIEYNQGEDKAMLNFQPLGDDNFEFDFMITVSEEDQSSENNLFSSIEERFHVSILRYVNMPPLFDDPEDVLLFLEDGLQSFMLTGISDGDEDREQNLSLEVENDRPEYMDISVDYDGGDEALLLFTPSKTLRGGSVKLVLRDDGGDFGGGICRAERTLGIQIMAGSSLSGLNTGTDEVPLRVFPNPVFDKLYLRNIEEITTVRMIDLSGKTILEKTNQGGSEMELDCKSMAPGACFLVLTTCDRQLEYYKIILNKE